jgi:hypothetical protein
VIVDAAISWCVSEGIFGLLSSLWGMLKGLTYRGLIVWRPGITGMGKRNIVGVRCSIRLEVPIVQAGRMLVTDDYLRFLTVLANKKMELNRQRTDMFLMKFIEQVSCPSSQLHFNCSGS